MCTGCRRATTPARPARTFSSGSTTPSPATMRRRGASWSRTTRCPAVMGRVCYHPCETACNRAQLDDPVGIHGVERFLGDEAIRQGWQLTVDAEPTGKRVLVVGAGPSGLSAAYQLARRGHTVTIRDAGPHRRRHDALRHSHATACRATSWTPRSRASSTSASRSNWTARSRASLTRYETAASTRRSWPSARISAGVHTFPPARPRTSSTPSRCWQAWRDRSARCSAGASSCTAAGTRRSTPPAPPSASGRATRSSSTAAPASGCPRTTSRSRRRSRRA